MKAEIQKWILKQMKVGDIVEDNLGNEHYVAEVLPNSFGFANRPTMLRRLEFIETEFAEQQGWKIKYVKEEERSEEREGVELGNKAFITTTVGKYVPTTMGNYREDKDELTDEDIKMILGCVEHRKFGYGHFEQYSNLQKLIDKLTKLLKEEE